MTEEQPSAAPDLRSTGHLLVQPSLRQAQFAADNRAGIDNTVADSSAVMPPK
jgi:hypothetical protein